MSISVLIKVFSGLLCLAGGIAAVPAQAAPGSGYDPDPGNASARGTATATVITPLQVRALSSLDFGTVASDGRTAGTVIISPTSTHPHYSGGAKPGCSKLRACPANPAEFAISGEASRQYRITLPRSAIARSRGASAGSLVVSNLTMFSRHSGSKEAIARLDASGRDTVNVGGTLHIAPDTPPGQYVAQIAIVVTYS